MHTNHASLRWLPNVTDPSGRLIRWRLRLSELDFEVIYKKGRENTQADVLSHLPSAGSNQDPVDYDVPCFLADCFNVDSATRLCSHLSSDGNPSFDHDDYGVCDDLLALGGGSADSVMFEAITAGEIIREQAVDSFLLMSDIEWIQRI